MNVKQWIVILVILTSAGCGPDQVISSPTTIGIPTRADTNTPLPTATKAATALPTEVGTPIPTPPGTLVWSDEFDGNGLPDPAKWDYEEGYVRNDEVQYYTRARLENAQVENGVLVITARKEDDPAMPVTSASLITHNKFDFTYGSIEVRAMVPKGTGTWPAIWTLGSNMDSVGWPKCGEIDIMEYVGFLPNELYFTVHTQSGGVGNSTVSFSPYKNFHVFRLDWTPQALTWFYDGKQVHQYANDGSGEDAWPFDKPEYLLVNLAIGGAWGGQQGVRDEIYPAKFIVDYVRIYQNP